MKTLKISDLTKYPNLQLLVKDDDGRYFTDKIESINFKHNSITIYEGWDFDFNHDYEIERIQMKLRPLSQLTDEIEIDGKKIIPLVELAKISQVYFDEHIIRCETKKYELHSGDSNINELHFIVEVSNMGSLHYQFSYDREHRRFSLRDNTTRIPLSFINQIELFDNLYNWKFDLEGYIENGLAVDLNYS